MLTVRVGCVNYNMFPMANSAIRSVQEPELKKWAQELTNVIRLSNDNIANKHVVIVALARKMPRLLEFFDKIKLFEEDQEESQLSGLKLQSIFNLKDIDIITEHAIPFYLTTCDLEKTNVIVLDDFIVYGASSELVAESVYYITGKRPVVLALGHKEKPLESTFACANLSNYRRVIEPKLLSNFTTTNSYRILSLNKPLDMEYTILSVKVDKNILEDLHGFVENVKSIFKTENGFTVYRTKHTIPFEFDNQSKKNTNSTNVTVCYTPTNSKRGNNDFTKLRFYIDKEEVQIACYAPNILDEKELTEDNPLFLGSIEGLITCWNNVCRSIPISTAIQTKLPNDIWRIFSSQTYSSAEILSKVVWANYLSSFANVVLVKDNLSQLFRHYLTGSTDLTWNVNERDISYLIGPKLCKGITKELQEIFKNTKINTADSNYKKNNYKSALYIVPDIYLKDYDETVSSHIKYSKDVREALSLIFTNMHYNIGLFIGPIHSTSNPPMLERYQFGETYDSLYDKLWPRYYSLGEENLRLRIHEWIDEKVDLGVVVPKYESSQDEEGRTIWRRYFRAGENEDSYMLLIRYAIHYINQKFSIDNCKARLTFSNFYDSIYADLERVDTTYPDLIQLQSFKQPVISYRNEEEIRRETANKLWSFMTNIPVIRALSADLEGEYEICDNNIARSLSQGIPIELL